MIFLLQVEPNIREITKEKQRMPLYIKSLCNYKLVIENLLSIKIVSYILNFKYIFIYLHNLARNCIHKFLCWTLEIYINI